MGPHGLAEKPDRDRQHVCRDGRTSVCCRSAPPVGLVGERAGQEVAAAAEPEQQAEAAGGVHMLERRPVVVAQRQLRLGLDMPDVVEPRVLEVVDEPGEDGGELGQLVLLRPPRRRPPATRRPGGGFERRRDRRQLQQRHHRVRDIGRVQAVVVRVPAVRALERKQELEQRGLVELEGLDQPGLCQWNRMERP
eukprot:SAG22_NODE_2528_length_2474_cov_2.136421_3_plen_193_part_00